MADPVSNAQHHRRFRHSGSFGKRAEYLAIPGLLHRGFDVCQPLVDDRGIDCIVRDDSRGDSPSNIALQNRGRSLEAVPKDAGFFAGWKLGNPRENYSYMFYSEPIDTWWILPSIELDRFANQNKRGKNAGKRSIKLAVLGKSGLRPRPKFKPYEGEAGIRVLRRALETMG